MEFEKKFYNMKIFGFEIKQPVLKSRCRMLGPCYGCCGIFNVGLDTFNKPPI